MVKHGLVEKLQLVAERGHILKCPGTVYIEIVKEGEELASVKVGGQAVTVMEGELFF